MKKSLLITAIVLALSGGAFAQTVLPLLPAAHGMTGNQPAYSAQQQQEFPAMATGWNWWSSYIDLSDGGLEMLENALGNSASTIKSKTSFTSYNSNNNSWIGSLTSINNTQMYMISMTSTPAEYVSLTNQTLTINDVEITAAVGWTWVGFPSNTPISVNDAMADFSTEAPVGAMIKGKSQFATYNGIQWIGSLTTLTPGQGYMIHNTSSSAIDFHYAPSLRAAELQELPNTRWIADPHTYPNNMSMIAIINLMGEELRSSDYEVAAYVGNECRGAIVPQYVESLDRYIAFLNIDGEERSALNFRLLDHETGDTYIASNSYTYLNDAVEGGLDEPYVLYFNTLMGNDEFVASHLDLFPNPAKRGQMVRISIPANHSNLKVIITNTLGMTVKTFNMSSDEASFTVNMAPGIYTVKVVSSNKQLYVEKLIVE